MRGMAWAYGSYVGGRILVLASTAVLARLLTPEDFGVVALAITFMALLEGFADLGLSAALVIQDEKRLSERAQTVFVSSVALGVVLAVVIAALAPLMAEFFDEPELTGIAAALGCNFFLRSLGSTHYALAQKKLDFKTRTAAEFADVSIRGATGVILAVVGFGAWSLVIGYLIGTVALVVVLWHLVAWRPTRSVRLSHLRELLGFGTKISGVNIVATLIANVDYLVVGRVLGAASLGLYTLGFRLPELLVLNLSVVAGAVLFPAFSTLDREGLARAFTISLRYTLMIGVPLAVTLATLAEPLVLTLFGDQWGGSVDVMRILAVYSLGVAIGIPAGTVYKSTGRAGVLLALGLVRLALVVTGLYLFVDQGLNAVAAVQATVAALAAVVGIGLATRLIGVGLPSILQAMWPAVFAGAVMAVPMLVVVVSLDEAALIELALAGLTGWLAYLATLWILAPDSIRYLYTTMFPDGNAPKEGPAEV
jgi:O-antigen/teichoic acid export membrane protein